MTVVPLIVLLQMEGCSQRLSISDYDNIEKVWQDINITSMAANVQLVFYRNKQGDVLVKALHNEAEVRLPLAGDNAPYYPLLPLSLSFYEKDTVEWQQQC